MSKTIETMTPNDWRRLKDRVSDQLITGIPPDWKRQNLVTIRNALIAAGIHIEETEWDTKKFQFPTNDFLLALITYQLSQFGNLLAKAEETK